VPIASPSRKVSDLQYVVEELRQALGLAHPWDVAPDGENGDAIIDMKPQPEPSAQDVLAGLVERVTYHNGENGFCVLRAKARGHRDLVTIVGHATAIAAGEWINDHTHGQQFKAPLPRFAVTFKGAQSQS
jgi:hypothetical protein